VLASLEEAQDSGLSEKVWESIVQRLMWRVSSFLSARPPMKRQRVVSERSVEWNFDCLVAKRLGRRQRVRLGARSLQFCSPGEERLGQFLHWFAV
jgi:hypothetical protein